MNAPFTLTPPRTAPAPLLVTSPHSGCDYPAAFLAASRLNPHDIRRSEDMFVDALYADAPEAGAHFLAARFPRAYIDLNRAPDEWDSLLFSDNVSQADQKTTQSAHVAAGLGVVPRLVADNMPIYHTKITQSDVLARMQQIYHPFHSALAALVAEKRAAHGMVILLDAHSMPAQAAATIDIAIGNRYGTSATPALAAWCVEHLTAQGFRVGLNTPFAGGYIVEHYGAPAQNIHALQIEINRGAYMNERTQSKNDNFAAVQAQITAMLQALRRVAPQFSAEFSDTQTRQTAAE